MWPPALIALAGLGIGWLTGIVYAGCKPGGSLDLHFRMCDLQRENEHLRELLGLEVNASLARHPAGRARTGHVADLRYYRRGGGA
jgi:hypothetical protein